MRQTLLFCVLFAAAGLVWAHDPMDHDCQAPIRPVDEHNDVLWNRFLAEIDGFRACVNRKKEWHEAKVLEHNQAARQVVEEWNTFVHGSLNAPEDFPWPPED